jgi:hypothetical protein
VQKTTEAACHPSNRKPVPSGGVLGQPCPFRVGSPRARGAEGPDEAHEAGCQRSIPFRPGRAGPGGHSGEPASPKGGGDVRGATLSPRDPRNPTETAQSPVPKPLTRGRSMEDRQGSGPQRPGRGVPRHKRAARWLPRDAPAGRATPGTEASALPPPLPHRGLARRDGYFRRPPAHRPHAPPAAPSPPRSSPRPAPRRPPAHLHASAQQPTADGSARPQPDIQPAAPRAQAPPPARRPSSGPAPAATLLFWCAKGRGVGREAAGRRPPAWSLPLTSLPGRTARANQEGPSGWTSKVGLAAPTSALLRPTRLPHASAPGGIDAHLPAVSFPGFSPFPDAPVFLGACATGREGMLSSLESFRDLKRYGNVKHGTGERALQQRAKKQKKVVCAASEAL